MLTAKPHRSLSSTSSHGRTRVRLRTESHVASSLKLRLYLSLSAVRLAAGVRGRGGSRSGAPASALRAPVAVGVLPTVQRYSDGRRVWWCTQDATHSLMSVWSPPAPPATTRRQHNKRVSPRNMFATTTDTDPPPSPQTARASLAASPMYDPGVSSSKRVLASSGISSVCTKARMPAASTRRPRVSSLSFS